MSQHMKYAAMLDFIDAAIFHADPRVIIISLRDTKMA